MKIKIDMMSNEICASRLYHIAIIIRTDSVLVVPVSSCCLCFAFFFSLCTLGPPFVARRIQPTIWRTRARAQHSCLYEIKPAQRSSARAHQRGKREKSIFLTATAAQKDVSVRKQARNSIRGPQFLTIPGSWLSLRLWRPLLNDRCPRREQRREMQ